MSFPNGAAAVVTGGASGLGEAAARRLAREGARVALLDRDAARGAAVAAEIGGVFIEADVADAGSVKAAFETARARHGPERMLVCCAGIAPAAKIASKGAPHDADLFAQVIRVNLLGVFHAAAEAAAGMSQAPPLDADGFRGLIVMTASIAATDGQVGQAAYAASKAGVAGLTLPMARDLSRDGVRVVTIAPGLFRTPMLAGLPDDVQASLGAQTPFPARLGDPEEFAALTLHAWENKMLNGSILRLDGAIRLAPR